MALTLNCAKCSAQMEEGMVVDLNYKGAIPSMWVEDQPREGAASGGVDNHDRKVIPGFDYGRFSTRTGRLLPLFTRPLLHHACLFDEQQRQQPYPCIHGPLRPYHCLR